MSSDTTHGEALQLVYLCEAYLRRKQFVALRLLLGSSSVMQCPAFWSQLLSPVNNVTLIRSIAQGIVGTLLFALREKLPAEEARGAFDQASQCEGTDALLPTGPVMQLESQTAPAPSPGTAPIIGLHLFALLHACRAPKIVTKADQAIEDILSVMEDDRRATVNLAALASTLQGAIEESPTAVVTSAAAYDNTTTVTVAPQDRKDQIAALVTQVLEELNEKRDGNNKLRTPLKEGREEQPQRPQPRAEPLSPLPLGGRVQLRPVESFDDVDAPDAAGASASGPLAPRVRYAFTEEEDAAILEGVQRFGSANKFQDIFHFYAANENNGGRSVWHPSRTPAHIADHFRQTLRRRRLLGE